MAMQAAQRRERLHELEEENEDADGGEDEEEEDGEKAGKEEVKGRVVPRARVWCCLRLQRQPFCPCAFLEDVHGSLLCARGASST
jgi:hypothetical protein